MPGLGQTIFTLSTPSEGPFPVKVAVSWASDVAARIRAVREHGAGWQRVNFTGMVTDANCLDVSRDPSPLKAVRYDLRCWKPQPAADFLLQWGKSAGLLLGSAGDLRMLVDILHVFCQHVINDIRIATPEAALVEKFARVEGDFTGLFAQPNIPIVAKFWPGPPPQRRV